MIDPSVLVGQPGVMASVEELGARLRDVGYAERIRAAAVGDPLVDLGYGRPVEVASVENALGDALVADLCRGRLLRRASPGPDGAQRLELAGILPAIGPALGYVPDHEPDQESARVYAGRDTMWLVEVVWHSTPGGERAVDLGAGPGLLSAVMARRFRVVVAADVARRAAATAMLTRALNRGSDRGPRFVGAVVADVAGGLRAGAFDLVTANAPWVPSAAPDERGEQLLYADGGERGSELPRRFALEGASLLAPGGLFVMLTLDAVWSDGHEPVAELRAELEDRGLSTRVIGTRMTEAEPDFEDDMLAVLPELRAARHVALLARRPRRG